MLFGINNIFAIVIIFINAMMGLAINFIYKIFNAVVKTLASCFSMAVLVFISAAFFRVSYTLHTLAGAVVVIVSTFI